MRMDKPQEWEWRKLCESSSFGREALREIERLSREDVAKQKVIDDIYELTKGLTAWKVEIALRNIIHQIAHYCKRETVSEELCPKCGYDHEGGECGYSA